MKRVTASEARRRWFRLLDEAGEGEVIVVHRKGHRLVLRREEPPPIGRTSRDFRRLLRVPDADKADAWSWQWRGPHRPLAPRRANAR